MTRKTSQLLNNFLGFTFKLMFRESKETTSVPKFPKFNRYERINVGDMLSPFLF